MSLPATSLALTTVTINSLNLLELTQDLDIMAQNTLVNTKGAADRYVQNQITKQKQTITFNGHWNNANLTPNIKATNLSIGLYTLGGTAYVGYLKNGSIEITTSGPEVSGIAQLEEVPVPTSTDFTVTGDIQIATQDALNYLNMTAVEGGFGVTVAISWAIGGSSLGEAITFDGILSSTSHKVSRDQAQMENVTIKLMDTVNTPTVKYNGTNETTSILYAAMLGTAVSTFDIDTGVNLYNNNSGQTAMISRYSVRFADKQVITQSFTLEVQGGMAVTEGG
jgi:hypothetical protein